LKGRSRRRFRELGRKPVEITTCRSGASWKSSTRVIAALVAKVLPKLKLEFGEDLNAAIRLAFSAREVEARVFVTSFADYSRS
jgi:hypothetical protein